MVREIDTKDEFVALLKEAGDKAVIVDFTATWCGPCKMIGPKFVAMAAEFPSIICVKVDVDENAETAEEEGVTAMPTFKVYKNGSKVDELTGANEGKLRSLFEKYR